MSRKIPQETKRKVCHLRRVEKLPIRTIAVQLRVSLSSVRKILRRDTSARSSAKCRKREREREKLWEQNIIGRCETCGAMVALPCRACRLAASSSALEPLSGDESGSLDYNLQPEIEARRAEVYRQARNGG